MKYIKLFFIALLFTSFIACDSEVTHTEEDKTTDTDNTKKDNSTTVNKDNSNDKVNLPKSLGYVNDFEGLFNEEEVKMYTDIITAYEAKTGNEIGIVSTDNYNPYPTIAEYGKELINFWGVGKKDKNNGLLIIVSKKRQEVRIAMGLGTEKVFSSEESQEVVDNVMIPHLSNGDFAEAVYDGLEAIIKAW